MIDIWGLFPSFGYHEYATMKIHVQVFEWTYVFISINDISMNQIAESNGNSTFPNGYTILHSQ